MNDATLTELRDAAVDAGDREVWRALAIGMIASVSVSRLPPVGMAAVHRIKKLIGCGDPDEPYSVHALSREQVRTLVVCLFAALFCGDALRREAFVRAFVAAVHAPN